MSSKFSIKKTLINIFLLFIIILFCTYIILKRLTSDTRIILLFIIFTILITLCVFTLLCCLFHKLTLFTNGLNKTIDSMIKEEFLPLELTYDETLLSQVNQHLYRLYNILITTKNTVKQREIELQKLITDISHQIKTPMTTIKLSEDAMKKAIYNPDDMLSLLELNSAHLNKIDFLLSSLITTSRLETGIITLYPCNKNICDTILAALENIVVAASKKNIQINFEYSEKYFAYHDTKWTAEAIYNILDNAIKYTPENGCIDIEVSSLDLYIKITIKDSGIGIFESEIPKIFQRFYRSQSVKELPGIGVGLYLARDIITRQYGFIHVSSSPKKGSTFEIYLSNSV